MNPNVPDPNTSPNTSNDNRPAAAGAEVIATGDRREEIHFEADPDQLVVVRNLVKPPSLAPEDPANAAAAAADAPPVEDVRVAPDAPSVWDARPPAEDA